jgi:hypothetical protein
MKKFNKAFKQEIIPVLSVWEGKHLNLWNFYYIL